MYEENDLTDEVVDFDPYEDAPEFDAPQAVDEGDQDFLDVDVLSFMPRSASGINTWEETLEWYRKNTTTSQIGFNPDGMCLKICRTARGIPSMYPSAKAAQDATPSDYRITKVRDLRRGMVAYFDEPNDSNRFGHIVTIIGRVKNFDPDRLGDVLTVSNSIQRGRLTVVRADYYERYWGDRFVFASTILNGVELDTSHKKSRVEKFHDSAPAYDLKFLHRAHKAGRPKPGVLLNRIETQIKRLPDSPKLVRVREFKDGWREDRVIDMRLLDKAVAEGRTGLIKQIRDQINRLIDQVPDE